MSNYLSEIKRITAQNDVEMAGHNPLISPLFVLMIDIEDSQRKEAIRRELSQRWAIAQPFVFLCDIRFNSATPQYHFEERDGIFNITYGLNAQSNEETIKAQLSLWFSGLCRNALQALQALGNNNAICVLCDASSEAAPVWAARCCMILHHCISVIGGQVRDRKFFCFLSHDIDTHWNALCKIRDACRSWRSQIPTEPMYYRFQRENGGWKPAVPALPCNGNFNQGETSVFKRYILLDELDSNRVLCSEQERIRLVAMLMDPTLHLQWPVQEGDFYSAYRYPMFADDHSLDLALAWKCLQARFLTQIDGGSYAPDLAPLHSGILNELHTTAERIPNRLAEFSIYQADALERMSGHKDVAPGVAEQAIFGDVLQNKFDYLWIQCRQRLMAEFVPQWKMRMQEQIDSVQSLAVLQKQNRGQFYMDAAKAKPSVQGGTVSISSELDHIPTLAFQIGQSCYTVKSTQQIQDIVAQLNKIIDQLLDARAEKLIKLRQRAERLGNDAEEAIQSFQHELQTKLGPGAPTYDMTRRAAEVEANLPEALFNAYARAIDSDEEAYPANIVDVFQKCYDSFLKTGFTPIPMPPLQEGDRIACRVQGGIRRNGAFAMLEGGRDDGHYYYIEAISETAVQAFNAYGTPANPGN